MELNNVFKIEIVEKEVKVIFENDGQIIKELDFNIVNNFFKFLVDKYVDDFKISFDLGPKPTKESGVNIEKAFAYTFASSFKEEWEKYSIEFLEKIKEAKNSIIEIKSEESKGKGV